MTINKSKLEIHQDDDKLNLILTLRLSEVLFIIFPRRIWSAVDSSSNAVARLPQRDINISFLKSKHKALRLSERLSLLFPRRIWSV